MKKDLNELKRKMTAKAIVAAYYEGSTNTLEILFTIDDKKVLLRNVAPDLLDDISDEDIQNALKNEDGSNITIYREEDNIWINIE